MQKNKNILFQRIIENWLEEKKISVKETTFERYQCITNVLINYFHDKTIRQITSNEINKFISERKEKGWRSSSLLMTVGIIKSITKNAKNKGYLQNFELKICKIKRETKKIEILTESESKITNKKLSNSDSSYDIAILVALNMGLRIGEICALRWKDIDLNRKRLSINGTVHRVKINNGGHLTKLIRLNPKNISSTRDIPMPDFICSILSKKKSNTDSYVLTGSAQQIPEPRNIQRRFKEFCKSNFGINMNFHCLRHTFATLSISRGIDEKIVSEILGHSSVTTTLKIYRGVNFDDKVNGMRTLEAFIGPKNN